MKCFPDAISDYQGIPIWNVIQNNLFRIVISWQEITFFRLNKDMVCTVRGCHYTCVLNVPNQGRGAASGYVDTRVDLI